MTPVQGDIYVGMTLDELLEQTKALRLQVQALERASGKTLPLLPANVPMPSDDIRLSLSEARELSAADRVLAP